MFTVAIETGNDAFYPNPSAEVSRILRELADRIDAGEGDDFLESSVIVLKDYNGQRVGQAKVVAD